MSQLKNRLQALSLLDRAVAALTDSEIEAIYASLPDDHHTAIEEICGASDGGFTDAATRALAIRATAARGKMTGQLEQIATILTDPCLAKCIELLGEHSDNPTEPQLQDVVPALLEGFGLGATRLMLATSIAGEAAASAMLTRVLKHDETLALPPVEVQAPPLLPAPQADADLKAKRKAAKEKKQADARNRREQQLRAAHR